MAYFSLNTLQIRTKRLLFAGLALLLALPASAAGDVPHAAIASAHPLATTAGAATLREGGNAFDAAVAVAATLAVVEPYSSGLGGGGFWLLHQADSGRQVMVDGRETAPGAATADMYVDAEGNVRPRASLDGPLAAGIPGTPAALVHIAERYGRLPLAQSLAPAIRLAREGFAIDAHYQRLAEFRLQALRADPEAARIFLDAGEVPPLGWRLRQPEVAQVLEGLAREGARAFYGGALAERLVTGVRAGGGIWREQDLAEYAVVERAPIVGEYRGMRVVSAPPPSSGGVGLVTMLNVLSDYPLDSLPEAERTHLVVEAMRRAYRDRAEYLGDPDFVDIPLGRLLDETYAAGLRTAIHPARATPSALLKPAVADPAPGEHTTHFSILDAQGNRVAATLTVNYPFGAAYVPAGTGILLNNEMDDFASQPGVPNVYGLVGSDANAIAPGKRPLSSMTPTFIEGPERMAILGTPGGSRIISMVLLGTLEFSAGNTAEAMVSRPRYHHQYLPDHIQHEPGAVPPGTMRALEAMGHVLEDVGRQYGNMQAVVVNCRTGEVDAASDPRGIGSAAVLPARQDTPSRSAPHTDVTRTCAQDFAKGTSD